MVLPEVLLKWASGHRQAVLVVVPTQYAAQMMVESFVNFRKWKRYQLQLRTGADKDDVFHREYTPLSIVTWNAVEMADLRGWRLQMVAATVQGFAARRARQAPTC